MTHRGAGTHSNTLTNRHTHTHTVASSPYIDFPLANQLLSHLCGDRLTHEAC